MDNDLQELIQFKTRATGSLFMGPMRRDGYDNKVLKLTVDEMEFKNSKDAQRFLDYQRKKYQSYGSAMNSRKLKVISQNDDR